MAFALKIIFAAIIISFVSWLSGKKMGMAGFLTALPLTSMIALLFSRQEWGPEKAVHYAKSIFSAVPLSLLFFVPFLFAEKFNLGFGVCYILGIALLGVGYSIHQYFI